LTGAGLALTDAEGDGQPHLVRANDVAKALILMAEQEGPNATKRLGRFLCSVGIPDAEDCDVLVQLAVFGEVKYG
jgi:hypothetical protein